MTLATKSSYVDGAFVPLGSSADVLENRNLALAASIKQAKDRFVPSPGARM